MGDGMFFVVVLTIFVGLIGCHAAPGSPAQSASPTPIPPDTLIKLERTVCYGSCPAYTLTISANGTVTYDGKAFVKTKRPSQGHITQDQVSQLIDAFLNANYFSLKDRYTSLSDGCPTGWTDNPTATTSLRLNGKSKTIVHYYGCREVDSPGHSGGVWPPALFQLEKRIDEIVGTAKWTK